jgi:hypothetical protein
VANGLTLTDGDIAVASGHGISFAADSSASGMASELFHDYEEGTFTAAMDNSVTLHSGIDLLSYTKIGRMVTVGGQFRIDNANSGANLSLNNLPFTVTAQTENDMSYVGALRAYQLNLHDNTVDTNVMPVNNTTTLQFLRVMDDAVSELLSASTNAFIAFTITYPTSS